MQLLSTLFSDMQEGQDTHQRSVQNTQAFKVHFHQKQYIIETNQKAVTIAKHLIIDRVSGNVREQDGSPQGSEQTKAFSAFLGTIYILDKAFLLLVEDASLICTIEGHDIFQIETVSFLPYEQESQIYASTKAREILNMIQNLRQLLMVGFYFSYRYDLTLSKMQQAITAQTDERFLWNLNLIRSHLKTDIDRKWLTFIIQGFVGYFYLYLYGKQLNFYLISRRSSKRAGTRYNARGIDDNGNVANYVETEQLIYYNNLCFSHLQIRGSVPAFWGQRGYMTETKIFRTAELTKAAFRKHFRDVCEDYSRVICLNLMAKKKAEEQMVTEAYEEQIKQNSDFVNIKYEWFDFHHECKNSDFSQSNPLIYKLLEQIKNFGYYLEDQKNKQIQMIQHGIFRTNCMDCLDRTNFIQAKIAMSVFDLQMKHVGVDFTQLLKMTPIEALDENAEKVPNYFIYFFKNIWADNGDMLSAQYTGTGSTHTNITRTGKRDYTGMLDHGTKSLMRFYKQCFSDNVKQEAIDVLLGSHTETVNKFTIEIEKQLKARKKEYCDYSERTILIITWNLGGASIPTSFDLNKQLLDYSADIIVFGLQEMVTSGTGLVVGSSQYLKDWEELIKNNLKLRENYVQVKSKELLGLGLFIFSKDRFKDRISKVSYDTIKLGFLGQVANKGAVIIKMYIDDTLLCFTNCHLEHGQKSLQTRLVNLKDLHQQAFNTIGIGKKKEERIDQCDYRFLFGDLNFRISLEADKVITQLQRQMLFFEQNRLNEAKEIIAQLMRYDELKQNQTNNQILKSYHEPDIQFLPTYKFEPYSVLYDKARTPSWTDRILIGQDEQMESKYLYYKSHDINYSDHRPVAALLSIKTFRENELRKDQIVKELCKNDLRLNQEEN